MTVKSLFKKSLRNHGQWLLAITIAFVLIFASGCENQMSTQRGVISGLVLDESGNRVTGALLTSHRSLFKAETDENGHYSFTSLDVGTHRLSVAKDGFYIASRTVELGYGEVLEGINIIVENVPNLITWNLVVREKNRVVLDVNCAEPMAVIAAWREVGSARSQTAPTQVMLQHQIELPGLFPGATYQLQVEGHTADGRKFASQEKNFTTVHPLDLAGAPEQPKDFNVKQGTDGPMLSWEFSGQDALQGFRIYRSVDAQKDELLFDEQMVFAAQRSLTDENTEPGKLYGYKIQSVDYENNVSSLTTEIRIIPAGKIERDLTWSKAWSPIHLSGDINIPAGRTLTIEPGVNLVFNETDEGRTGYKPLSCEFLVEGTLLAEGSAAEPIRMISAAAFPQKTDWDGLRLISTSSQNPSVIRYVEIAGAETGIALHSSNASASNLLFRFCQTGLAVYGLKDVNLSQIEAVDCDTGVLAENTIATTLQHIRIAAAQTGIRLLGNKDLSVSAFDIRNATEVAVETTDREGLRMRNGLLHSNKVGLDAGGAISDYQYLTIDAVDGIVVNGADVPIIKNNIIVNQVLPGSGAGIEDKKLGRSYAYNNIFGFQQATFNCDQSGGPILNVDPLFIGLTGGNFDYHLQSSSPLKTASQNNGQPGAYGSDS